MKPLWPWKQRERGGGFMTTKTLLLLFAFAICFPSDAFARRRSYSSYSSIPAGCSNATAQDVANCCAADGRLAHRGGNTGYEGLGMGSTPEQAYQSCCYASRTDLVTVDVGYAQMPNGMWCSCRRYAFR